MVVFFEYLVSRPTTSKKVHYKLDGDASPLNDRLADQDFRIHDDAIVPIHRTPLFVSHAIRSPLLFVRSHSESIGAKMG